MELTLEIVSFHRLSPEQVTSKDVISSLTIGRADTNDWHLPDPEKVVSGTHARITKRSDGFYIEDLSTNGLYINRSVEALGSTKPHKIEHDDLLTLGDYEVSAKMINGISSGAASSTQSAASVSADPFQANQVLDSNPFENEFEQQIAGFDAQSLLNQAPSQSQPLPDVNGDLQDHFQPPGMAIPEEWGQDFFNESAPVAEPQVSMPVSQPVTNQAAPQPAHQQPQSMPPQQLASMASQQQVTNPHAAQSAAQQATRSEPKPQVSNQVQAASSLSQAFFKGFGIDEQEYSKVLTEELMFELGQSMQLMLTGLMDSLRQRSKLKTEFRINQTTFQQRENNPLKFSASLDDVFQNLYLRKSASFLSSQQAIIEAFNDGRKHDIALTAGTFGALRGLLNQLDPDLVEQKSQSQSFAEMLVPGQKQFKQWKVYKSLHEDLQAEFANTNTAALSDDFVEAYDNKIKSL